VAVDDGLDLAVALGWDDRGDVLGLEVDQDTVGIVTLVPEQHLRDRARLGHDGSVALDVVDLATGENDRDGEAQAIASQVDFGREAAARAAKTLVRTPFLAPAECWWARTMVLSII